MFQHVFVCVTIIIDATQARNFRESMALTVVRFQTRVLPNGEVPQ